MSEDGPKKYDTHPTMPSVGRMTVLAPTSVREAFIETLNPSDDEREEILASLESANREAVTLVGCPACAHCEFCHGAHMVEPEKAVAFAAQTVPHPDSDAS